MTDTTGTFESIHSRIERAIKTTQTDGFRWSDVRLFRRYYRGRQRGTLNADQLRIVQGVIGNRFSHNICQKFVDEKANRLEIARFDVEDTTVSDFLHTVWVKNQFPDLFADLMRNRFRDGNAYLGLGWVYDDRDPRGGRPTLSVERAWDGKQGVFVAYDSMGRKEFAVKEWIDPATNRRYRTVFFDDHIERYRQDGDGWKGYYLPDDPPLVPGALPGFVPWVKRDGTGIGIPIFHFPNGDDDDSNYGASELDGGILGFQDQINAIQHDITAAAMLTGSPRTWSKGFSLPTDPVTGEKERPRTGPGTHWHVEETTAEWGMMQPGDMAPLKMALDIKVQSACQMRNIPLHTITGQWPSGDAIFRSEMSLNQELETDAKQVGPEASSVMHMCTELTNTFGYGTPLNEEAMIQTVFKPVDRRDPLVLATYAEKIANKISEREFLRILQYAPDRIDQIMEEREEEAAKAVERQQALFAAGGAGLLPRNDNPNPPPDDVDEEE